MDFYNFISNKVFQFNFCLKNLFKRLLLESDFYKFIYKRNFQFNFIYKGINFYYFYWKQDFTILLKN